MSPAEMPPKGGPTASSGPLNSFHSTVEAESLIAFPTEANVIPNFFEEAIVSSFNVVHGLNYLDRPPPPPPPPRG